MNVANDMRLRLQNNFSALNWALDSPVHNDSLSSDAAADMCFGRNDEGRAVQLALNLTVDFDQTLSGYATDDLKSVRYHRSPTP